MEIFELKITDKEFLKIRGIVYKVTGIVLTSSKRALIISRLARRLRQLKMNCFDTYISLLERDQEEVLLLINRITTNLTRFYREKGQFSVLKEEVLPVILESKKRTSDKCLRVWSAGCSTGQEVYTILFELCNAFRGRIPMNVDLRILGTDIDTNVLKKADSAIYSNDEVKEIEPGGITKFFDQLPEDGGFKVKSKWRKFVGFKRINLVYDTFDFNHKLDIIFCRNVVIYFDKYIREKLYKKFHAALNDKGYFFSGHSENLFKYNHLFKFVDKAIYKKVV